MIYTITNKNFELSKSDLAKLLQKSKINKIRKFDYVDNSRIDEIKKTLTNPNQKNYTIVVLEVWMYRFK